MYRSLICISVLAFVCHSDAKGYGPGLGELATGTRGTVRFGSGRIGDFVGRPGRTGDLPGGLVGVPGKRDSIDGRIHEDVGMGGHSSNIGGIRRGVVGYPSHVGGGLPGVGGGLRVSSAGIGGDRLGDGLSGIGGGLRISSAGIGGDRLGSGRLPDMGRDLRISSAGIGGDRLGGGFPGIGGGLRVSSAGISGDRLSGGRLPNIGKELRVSSAGVGGDRLGGGRRDFYMTPKPYSTSYNTPDGRGGVQFRSEQGDGRGAVSGKYGFTDAQGLYRVVNYYADQHGFTADIKTNEPGVHGNENPAGVTINAEEPPAGVQERYTRTGVWSFGVGGVAVPGTDLPGRTGLYPGARISGRYPGVGYPGAGRGAGVSVVGIRNFESLGSYGVSEDSPSVRARYPGAVSITTGSIGGGSDLFTGIPRSSSMKSVY